MRKMKRTAGEGGDESKWRAAQERNGGRKTCRWEKRQRKTDGDLRSTVSPGLVLFIQGSPH